MPDFGPGKIKILYFIGSYVLGGKERQMTELIRNLPKDKFEIYLLTKSIKVYYFSHISNCIAGYYLLEAKRFASFKALWNSLKYMLKICPDIIHCWTTEATIIAICGRFFVKSKPIIIDGSIRDSWFPFKYYNRQWWIRKFINKFSTFTISNSLIGLKAYLVNNKNGICIYNGFNYDRTTHLQDIHLTRALFGINTEYVVGMVGRFNPHKDWDLFFEVVDSVSTIRNDVTFIAIGDGILYEQYKSKYKNQKHLVFTGIISNVEQLISIFDVGILLTNNNKHSEGISNSVMEYMAMEKPVIANRNGGNEELIENNVTGYLIDRPTKNELVNKILLLLDNTELRKQLGLKGHERLSLLFNIDKMISNYVKVYGELLHLRNDRKSKDIF
jgi:glycosyltransferase involved in cell wall biosynthesis